LTWLHVPFGGNGWLNTFLLQIIRMQQLKALLETVFSMLSVQRLYSEDGLESWDSQYLKKGQAYS
jgi:hypothetical protein